MGMAEGRTLRSVDKSVAKERALLWLGVHLVERWIPCQILQFCWKDERTHALRGLFRCIDINMDQAVRSELIEMDEHDQAVRAELAAEGSLFDGYHPKMAAVHDSNAARLRAIIGKHGWPTERLVGPDGAKAAHRIAQHAINHPEFMRGCRKLLEEASAKF
jgi:hypothetical protein